MERTSDIGGAIDSGLGPPLLLRETFRHRIRPYARIYIPLSAFALTFVVFGVLEPARFLTLGNGAVVLSQSAVLCVVGFGMTFVIMAGGIDLSVGSVVALTGIIACSVGQDYGAPAGLVAGLLTGLACGFTNGLVFSKLKIPSFITTLGMLTVARGAAYVYSQGESFVVYGLPVFREVGVFPWIVYVTLGFFGICHFLLNQTRFGRYCQVIGGDERVAVLTGVPLDRVKILIFSLCGFMAGVGGLLLASRVGAATPQLAVVLELDIISAVVLGGTPLTGGIGNVHNTILGALIMSMLSNGLVIMGIKSDIQLMIKGVVLILAVFLSLEREKIGIIK
jgi:ribose/xylose/arabinose/galactoside ABC-type transport system permease subunit